MKPPIPSFKTLFASTILLGLGAATGSAQLWTGGTNSNWNNIGNWNPAEVPSDNLDVAEFATGPVNRNITLEGGNFTVNRLIFSSSTAYTLNTGTITLGGTSQGSGAGLGQLSKTGSGDVTLGSGLTYGVGSGGNLRHINFNAGGAGTINLNNTFSGSGGTGLTINNHSSGAATVNWNASYSGFSATAGLTVAAGTTVGQTTTLRLINNTTSFGQLFISGNQGFVEAVDSDKTYNSSLSIAANTATFQGSQSITLNATESNHGASGGNSTQGIVVNNIASGKSLTLGGLAFTASSTNNRVVTFTGTGLTVVGGGFQHGGTSVNRALSLTKSGTGTLLIGANSFTSAGNASSTITIEGGRFAGNASIGYDPASSAFTLTTTVTAASTLHPGSLTDTGNMTFRNGLTATAANTNFEFTLNGTAAASQLAISGGDFNLANTRTYTFDLLNLGGTSLQEDVIYTLINPTGANWIGTATKSNFILGSLGSGFVLDTSYFDTGYNFQNGALTARFSAIPEPSAALLGLIGFGVLALRRRRAV